MERIAWRKMVTRPTFDMLFTEAFTAGIEEKLEEVLGVGLTNNLYVPAEKGERTWYTDESEFAAFGKRVVEEVKSNEDFAEESSRSCFEYCENLINVCRQFSEADLSASSNDQLCDSLQSYRDALANHTLFMIIPLAVERFVNEVVERGIEDILAKKEQSDEYQRYLEAVTGKTKLLETDKEELDLLDIASEINRRGGEIDKGIDERIEEHLKNYQWISVYALAHRPWERNDVLAMLKEIGDNPEARMKIINEGVMENERKFTGALDDLKPNENLSRMIKTLQEFIFLRTFRTDALRKGLHYSLPLMNEIGKRTGMSREEVAYSTFEELEGYLKTDRTPDIDEVRERLRHFIYVKKHGVTEIISDKDEVDRMAGEELREEKEMDVIKGQTAQPGVVVGRVKVILSAKEVDKVEKDEILVATMTSPEFSKAIHKVSGIITDEGGISCHAAIVSRELKIPCVIGTNVATKVLNDGDLVKLDADNGIIEKVKE